ncbi:hypothetical protein MACH17_01350 [Phaeobacter inhibens]|nr:hypothetical protein MACH17_01350 [Phaeobacter inhibens]
MCATICANRGLPWFQIDSDPGMRGAPNGLGGFARAALSMVGEGVRWNVIKHSEKRSKQMRYLINM